MTNNSTHNFGNAKPPAAPKERKQTIDTSKNTQRTTNAEDGAAIRQQVFEVIVRQALAGAPWRVVCDAPMRVNGINPEEVEAEVVRRRQSLD